MKAYEPYKLHADIPGVQSCTSLEEVIAEAEVILLLVGHKQLKTIDPQEIRKVTPARLVIDTVNGWDAQQWSEAGFKVFRLGVGSLDSVKTG